MSDIAIRVERLGKAYRIGLKEQRHETLLGAITSFVRSPLSNFRDVRKLSRFDDAGTTPTDANSLFSAPATSPEDVVWAIKDISFKVKPGEVVGIIGHNGAGKSTLLKILSRITEPTQGRAIVFGRVGSLLEVGTGFHPDLTGRENVYLNGTILGMKRREIDRKFDEIVEFSGVEKFIDTPVKRYSSGMRVRLAFSVAAHLEPEILIIDEVLSVGDAEFQKKCLGKMQDVSGEGRTVLFVSHNLTAVNSLCKRAILLGQGEVICDDSAHTVVARYLGGLEHEKLEVSWESPPTSPGASDQVWLKRISVWPQKQMRNSLITITTPLEIAVEYYNCIPDAVLNVSLVLNTAEGICVLNSCSLAKPCRMGLNRAICYIPANFLNDERYSVRILLVKDRSRPLLNQGNLITFIVHDEARTGGWFGKWEGVVRPTLEWKAEFVDSL